MLQTFLCSYCVTNVIKFRDHLEISNQQRYSIHFINCKILMQLNRSLFDENFNCYVLSDNKQLNIQNYALSNAVLKPMDATIAKRKAHWETKTYYNSLFPNVYLSTYYEKVVCYYINELYQIMQCIASKEDEKFQEFILCQLPITTKERHENVSLQVTNDGFLIVCLGNESIFLLHSMLNDIYILGAPLHLVYQINLDTNVTQSILLMSAKSSQGNTTMGQDGVIISILFAEPVNDSPELKEAAYRINALEIRINRHIIPGGKILWDGSKHQVIKELALVENYPHFTNWGQKDDAILFIEGKYVTQHSSKKIGTEESTVNDNMEMEPGHRGIGYKGGSSHVDPVDPGHSLQDEIFSHPLSERFQRGSKPYSAMEEIRANTRGPKPNEILSNDMDVDSSTIRALLGEMDECDNINVEATSCLLCFHLEWSLLKAKKSVLEIDAQSYRFLGTSAPDPGLLFQYDVHGALFQVSCTSSPSLNHASGLAALGYIQASKVDKKFVLCHASGNFAAIAELKRRLYIYCTGSPANEDELKQHKRREFVVEIGDEAILGCQLFNNDTIMLLTSRCIYKISIPLV